MTKSMLIHEIHKYLKTNDPEHKYTKAEIAAIYDAFIELIGKELEEASSKVDRYNKQEVISIPLIGKVTVSYYPKTVINSSMVKSKIKISEGRRLYLKPSKKLKEHLKVDDDK